MTRGNKTKPAARLLRSLYIWHRWIGLASAAFVILLALTGLALNHTGALALDGKYVQSPAVLDWYGIRAPDDVASYVAGPLTISSIGRQIYVDTARQADFDAPLAGAVLYGEFIVVATTDKLSLLTRSGELVEQLGSAAGVPANIRALGVTADERLVLQAGQDYYATNVAFVDWEKIDRPAAKWAHPTAPDAALVADLQQNYRGTGLSLERLMLDLHSGRILGEWGVYLVDGAAIAFLVLAASGMWLWGKRRASARAHRRRNRVHKK